MLQQPFWERELTEKSFRQTRESGDQRPLKKTGQHRKAR